MYSPTTSYPTGHDWQPLEQYSRRNLRVDLACERCRRLKTKCTGQTPACGRCTYDNVKCVYIQHPDRPKKAQGLERIIKDQFNELFRRLPLKPEEEAEILPRGYADFDIQLRAQKDYIEAKRNEVLELEAKHHQFEANCKEILVIEAKHGRLLELVTPLEAIEEKHKRLLELLKHLEAKIVENQQIEARIIHHNQLTPETEGLRIQQEVNQNMSYAHTAPSNSSPSDFATSGFPPESSYQTGSHVSFPDSSSGAQAFVGVADNFPYRGEMVCEEFMGRFGGGRR